VIASAESGGAAPPRASQTGGATEAEYVSRVMLALRAGVGFVCLVVIWGVQVLADVAIPWGYQATLGAWLAFAVLCIVAHARTEDPATMERIDRASLLSACVAGLGGYWFSGGLTWVGPLGLIFVLFGAAFASRRRDAYLGGALVIGGFAVLVSLRTWGVIDGYDPFGTGAGRDAAYMLATSTVIGVGLLTFFTIGCVIERVLTRQRETMRATSLELAQSRSDLQRLNSALEERVRENTQELAQRNRELEALAKVERAANASLEIDQAYVEFMRAARGLIAFDQASIAVYSEDRTRLRVLRGVWEDGDVHADPFDIDASTSLQASEEPRLFEDLESIEHDYVERQYLLDRGAVCGITVPLVSKETLLGSFNVVSMTRGAFGPKHVALMQRMAEPLALALANNRLYAAMRTMAERDALTGLPNQRALQQRVQEEVQRSDRYGAVCSVLMMDIDNFKVFNDSLGHQAGDDLLINFSRLVRGACREVDIVARQSGDEFVVLLPETGPESAYGVAQRIHDALAAAEWHYPGQDTVAVTTSIGIATFPQDGADAGALLNRADTAMYQAKAAGGGQTRMGSELVDEGAQDGPRQMRFGILETLANVVAAQLAEEGTRMRTLTAFILRAAVQIGEQLGMDETELRVLRVGAMSHALGIFPKDDPDEHPDNVWGLDERYDDIYLKLGRLFVASAPGLDDAVRAVDAHHHPLTALSGTDARAARILAVAEAYARTTAPGADPQLTPPEAIARLRADAGLDQELVAALALATGAEPARAA
jgi:diguanylate cyclase (GGDEF)-like protein